MFVMPYYKVVSKDLTSATHHAFDRCLAIQYKIGEWVSPLHNYAPLMCFNDLDLAKKFSKDMQNRYIFKCEIVKSRKKWGFVYYSNMKTVIELRKAKKRFSDLLGGLPPGTVLADKVKLLERIE